MKPVLLLAFAVAIFAAACGSVATNTGNNSNLRGQNTNTGYVTNTDANVKPTVPANAANLTPGNLTNGNSNSNANRTNSNTNHK
jgi:hypothetical protein